MALEGSSPFHTFTVVHSATFNPGYCIHEIISKHQAWNAVVLHKGCHYQWLPSQQCITTARGTRSKWACFWNTQADFYESTYFSTSQATMRGGLPASDVLLATRVGPTTKAS